MPRTEARYSLIAWWQRIGWPACVGGDGDFVFPQAGAGNVVAVLHPHQRVHGDAERLLDPQGHFGGQLRAFVQQRRQRRPGHAQRLGGVRYGEAQGLHNLALYEPAGVGGGFHADWWGQRGSPVLGAAYSF